MDTPPISRKNSGELEEKEAGEITWEEKKLDEIYQENIYKEKSTAELEKLWAESVFKNKKDINTFINEILSRDGITFKKLFNTPSISARRILREFMIRKRSNNRKYFSLYTIFIPKEFRVEFEQMDYPNHSIQLNTLTINQLGILLATILNTEHLKFRLDMIEEIADELKRRGVVIWKIMSILKGEHTIEDLRTLDNIPIPPFCYNDECSFCSLPFDVKQSVHLSCNHCFHKNCIENWFF